MTKIVYRITYNVYRLNTVASRKLIQGISRGKIPLKYLNTGILKKILSKENLSGFINKIGNVLINIGFEANSGFFEGKDSLEYLKNKIRK